MPDTLLGKFFVASFALVQRLKLYPQRTGLGLFKLGIRPGCLGILAVVGCQSNVVKC